jgi:hypothetical protein
MHMRGQLKLSVGIVLVGLLAFVAGTAHGAPPPKRVAFRVTLEAKVVKNWNALTQTTVNGCPTSHRALGRRVVTLESKRPTTVIVTLRGNRVVSYAPAAVRFLAGQVVQTGSRTTTVGAPCTPSTTRSKCSRSRRAVKGVRFGFFRSARNEITFRPAALPGLPAACPPESAQVRAIHSGLEEAEGEISEEALADSRIRKQTATGSAAVETDLEDEDEDAGRVVERVSWKLTFIRKR